ncbi:hypothetical protein SAMN05660199_01000 [Klenkia soli]|uniref:TFIIB-type zinc ribbon-containing protein n=1 Tax=Klenkia soli TaxID=1052260 RepID=A0A1H0FRP2_9ACTN|nr:hypothetical protein [Klenkia soli]SDN97305.1 hypothetical protein SAMN05660199_01000 [Klenkia soli]
MGAGGQETTRDRPRPDAARFREPATLEWQDPVLVICPRCGNRAVAEDAEGGARLRCEACTLRRVWSGQDLHVTVDGRDVVLVRRAGVWVDPVTGRPPARTSLLPTREARFGVPLWLVTECCGGRVLWARNEEHLDYLRAYVTATLRDRSGGLSTKLPTWMKRAGNRDEVIRAIARLRATLQ